LIGIRRRLGLILAGVTFAGDLVGFVDLFWSELSTLVSSWLTDWFVGSSSSARLRSTKVSLDSFKENTDKPYRSLHLRDCLVLFVLAHDGTMP